mmetsp:Transcript_15330/g.31644  ORF Transcript_15330/g.31644 Transcript_15330/m.31644 type:complete len:243 (-) Transcript_15330:1037-1765(-)
MTPIVSTIRSTIIGPSIRFITSRMVVVILIVAGSSATTTTIVVTFSTRRRTTATTAIVLFRSIRIVSRRRTATLLIMTRIVFHTIDMSSRFLFFLFFNEPRQMRSWHGPRSPGAPNAHVHLFGRGFRRWRRVTRVRTTLGYHPIGRQGRSQGCRVDLFFLVGRIRIFFPITVGRRCATHDGHTRGLRRRCLGCHRHDIGIRSSFAACGICEFLSNGELLLGIFQPPLFIQSVIEKIRNVGRP